MDAKTYPELEVAEAIRMSMSIPIVFEPVKLGQHLMVDGGVLSNFPISLFDASQTLGFRLRARAESIPFAPEGIRDYATAVVGAMFDGRDNYDVQSKELAGLIEIDPGRLSSTQFKLAKSEKADLYERGISAASKFFLEPTNTQPVFQLDVRGPASQIRLEVPADIRDDSDVRFSISALVRIEIDGQLLLVKGNRIQQYQPVGGVLKTFDSAREELRRLGVRADNKLPIDRDSKEDLRVFVPRRSIEAFVKWYLEGRGRESSPWREFYEELVETEILSAKNFQAPAFDYVGRGVVGIRWTQYFQCYEVLIAEVFTLIPTPEQAVELKSLCSTGEREEVLWASPALIRTRGYDSTKQLQVTHISEHSSWLLEADDKWTGTGPTHWS